MLERAPATATIPGPIMLPYQAFDALHDLGLLDEVRRAGGRAIAPRPTAPRWPSPSPASC